MTRRPRVGCAALVLLACVSCDPLGRRNGTVPPEVALKLELLESAELSLPRLPLEVRSTLDLLYDGVRVWPTAAAYDGPTSALIVSNRLHGLFRYDFGGAATERIEIAVDPPLLYPGGADAGRDYLTVWDYYGILTISRLTESASRIPSVYPINSALQAADGAVLVNPGYRAVDTTQPLILRLDASGVRVGGFGEARNDATVEGLDDVVFLASAGRRAAAVFRHRPEVLYLDLQEDEVVGQAAVSHEIFDRLLALRDDPGYIRPAPNRIALPSFAAGTAATAEGVFVLLDLPLLEIVQFDWDGAETARWLLEGGSTIASYGGFDARVRDESVEFIIATLTTNLQPALIQCSGSLGGAME